MQFLTTLYLVIKENEDANNHKGLNTFSSTLSQDVKITPVYRIKVNSGPSYPFIVIGVK